MSQTSTTHGPVPGDTPAGSALQTLYYDRAPDDVGARGPAAVAGVVAAHAALAQRRDPGEALVRVWTPTEAADGWAVGGTAVQVVVDDMPFLVDSVLAELTRRRLGVRRLFHPLVPVRRDAQGRLTATGEGPDESWIHVEVDRLDDDAQAGLATALRAVLADVRAAVGDAPAMAEAAHEVAASLDGHGSPAEVAEVHALLRWLVEARAALLGYARVEGGTTTAALGLLRDPAHASCGSAGGLLTVRRSPARSTVQRSAHLECVTVRLGDVEHRFAGLLSSAAASSSVLQVPVVRSKAREVLDRSGYAPDSHSGQDLLQILETYPVSELFQAPVAHLERVAHAVLRLGERRRLRLFVRRDDEARTASCLVYLPRDLYTRKVRLAFEDVLREAYDADEVDVTIRVAESALARLLLVVTARDALPEVDEVALEKRLAELARSWDDDLAAALVEAVGEDEAARLLRAFPEGLPEAYKADFDPATGAEALQRLDRLEALGGLTMHLRRPAGAARTELRLQVSSSAPLSLSAALPVLRHMSVEVVDSSPYDVVTAAGGEVHLYDIGLRAAGELYDASDGLDTLFRDAFTAVWSGAAEDDGYNALVLRGGLGWRQVVVLRAYGTYLRQSGWTFSPDYVEQCVVGHLEVARLLVELFEARFEPDDDLALDARQALVDEVRGRLDAAVDAVESRDADRILRAFTAAVLATTRTNAWQRTPDGRPKEHLAVKLDPHRLPELPQPRPEREVWVYSPRVEGVHLRFGAVARGGLRWSDRREDFRTEVLGLVKAQAVKNAVIVPVGAKGGFVPKRLPDPADREAWLAEGVAGYRTFVSGLLDLTDNRVGDRVVPPPRVVRWDGDDPYLVVAADKGTASLSDTANEVSAAYGFWLGDAFASGGSAGYDHKAMGITARGAWESVRRHFRDAGVDVQAEEITVAGIGDMCGDVFGNGMLLSERLRLVAAFDHRHVFLDPDPDPATSYAERRRLAALPRSSWADYDPALLSPGGGVFPRTAKRVPVSPQVRARLGLPDGTTSLAPPDLLRAVLRAPVDLLWNGAIGTYVKASTESHLDVGDKANDAVRVDGAELRCRVVGEGGNLGLTQRGRVEAALAGVRLNTDALDNSAGVDCSDHEVNIKVLLEGAVRDGALDAPGRDALLVAMTDDVAEAVLRHNRSQNVLLANARTHARPMLSVHRRFLAELEHDGALDRALEALPTDRELDARASAGRGLTSPELAVLVAYAKNTLKAELLRTGLADEPWCEDRLRAYFPPLLVERFGERLPGHPLRREIVVTEVVNDLVDRGGTSFAFRARDETGAPPAHVVQAYAVAREVFGMPAYWAQVEALDGHVAPEAVVGLHLEGRRLLDRAVRWWLQVRRPPLDVLAERALFSAPVQRLLPAVPDLVRGAEGEALQRSVRAREDVGVPTGTATAAAALLHGFPLLHAVELATRLGRPVDEVAPLLYAVSDCFGVDELLEQVSRLSRGDRWAALARSALRDDLYAALAALTGEVLGATAEGPVDDRIAQWLDANAQPLRQARARLEEIAALETSDLATVSVAVRALRSLLRA